MLFKDGEAIHFLKRATGKNLNSKCGVAPSVTVTFNLHSFLQCKEGGFPQELWLGVSADAVSVYKRGEGRPLEVFQYEHILSFGAPLANTYKIVVDERELLFETSEVRARRNFVSTMVFLF